MAYNTPLNTLQTVLQAGSVVQQIPTPTVVVHLRPTQPTSRNITVAYISSLRAASLDIFPTILLPIVAPILLSILAWLLLTVAVPYWIHPPTQLRGPRPIIRSRLKITLRPTIVLSMLQLSLGLLCSRIPTCETYEVKMTGKQEVHTDVSSVPWLVACSWVLTLGFVLAVLGVLAVLIEVGKWEIDGGGRKEEKGLAPLCP